MLYFCDLCPLSFKRSDHLQFHNQNIHEGSTFHCEHCSTFSTGRKYTLKKHILSQHTEEGLKPQPKFCKEEGCSFSSRDGGLRRHTESKHEGIVKFICYVMNCNFRSTKDRDMQKHIESHTKTETTTKIVKNVIYVILQPFGQALWEDI